MSILDGYAHDALTDALLQSDVLGDCTLTQQIVSGPPFDPVLVDMLYDVQGWVDDYSTLDRVNSAVLVNDRKIFLLASSLTALDVTPAIANSVTINGSTFTIVNLSLDPAGACWIAQCRV